MTTQPNVAFFGKPSPSVRARGLVLDAEEILAAQKAMHLLNPSLAGKYNPAPMFVGFPYGIDEEP